MSDCHFFESEDDEVSFFERYEKADLARREAEYLSSGKHNLCYRSLLLIRDMLSDVFSILRPLGDRVFWLKFLHRSSFFSMYISFLNVVVLLIVGFMSLHIEFIDPPSPVPFYRGTLSYQIFYWLVVNCGIILVQFVIKYLPSLAREFSDGDVLSLWVHYGYFILYSRFLLLAMSLKTYNVYVIKGLAAEYVISLEYSLCLVVLNTIQSSCIVIQPFPWSWANVLCFILLLEYTLVMYTTRAAVYDILPLYTKIEFIIYLVSGSLATAYMAGDFENINISSYKTNLQHKIDTRRKRRLVEMLCSDIKLPLQYLSNAIQTLPPSSSADGSAAQELLLQRINRNLHSLAYLVDGVLVLTKIDEERFEVRTDSEVDFPALLRKLLMRFEAVNHLSWESVVKVEVDVKNMLQSDAKCLEIVFNALLEYARTISALLKSASAAQSSLRCARLCMTVALVASELCVQLSSSTSSSSGSSSRRNDNNHNHNNNGDDGNRIHGNADRDAGDGGWTGEIDSRPVRANGFYLILCRASAATLGGKMLLDSDGTVSLRIPCVEVVAKPATVVRWQSTSSASSASSTAAASSAGDPRAGAAESGAGAGAGAGAAEAGSVGDIRDDTAVTPISIGVIAVEDGMQTCITSIFENLSYVNFEVLQLHNLDLALAEESKFISMAGSESALSKFDGVFVSNLEVCRLMLLKGFLGKIVLVSASLQYLDLKATERLCNATLAIPCSDSDVHEIFDQLWGKSQGVSHDDARSAPGPSVSRNNRIDSNRTVLNGPQGGSARSASAGDEWVEVLAHNHSLWASLSFIGRRVMVLFCGQSVWSGLGHLWVALDNLRFSLLGDFVGRRDDKVEGGILSQRFDFLPRRCFGMPLFSTPVEKNFSMWRMLHTNYSDITDMLHIISLISQLLARLYELYCHTHSYAVVVTNPTVWFYYFLIFRIQLNTYIWKHIDWGMNYTLWKLGGPVSSFLFLYLGFDAQEQVRIQYNDGLFADFEGFLSCEFGRSTGDQVFLALLVFTVILNTHWVSYFPWPMGIIFISGLMIRHFVLTYELYSIFTGSSPSNTGFAFLALLFAHHFFNVMVILYRDEVFQRESFQAYRKTRHSSRFMDHVYRSLIADLNPPLSELLSDKAGLSPLLQRAIESKQIVLVASLLQKWNCLCYGYSTLDCLSSQLHFRATFAELIRVQEAGLPSAGTGLSLSTVKVEKLIALIASPYLYLALSDTCDIKIFYSVSYNLAIIKTDVKLLKTLLSNALNIALKNIQRGLQAHPKSSVCTQQICIEVKEHPDFQVFPPPSSSSSSSSSTAPQPASGPGVSRLKFFDPHLLVVEVYDSGLVSSKSGSSKDAPSSYGFGEVISREIASLCGSLLSKSLGSKSFYSVRNVSTGEFSSLQRFTIPYKLHNLSMHYANNLSHRRYMSQRKCVTKPSDRLLEEYQRGLQSRGDYFIPRPHTLWRDDRHLPLMFLVYERPPSKRKMLGPSSPFFTCQNAFVGRHWRCLVVYDVTSPEFLTRMHEATCIVIDNCNYAGDEPSGVASTEDPGCLGRRIRLMGYNMIIMGMFSDERGASGTGECVISELRAGRSRSDQDYDIILNAPIKRKDMAEAIKICEKFRLPLLLQMHLDEF